MFLENPYTCFDKYPEHEAKPSTLCLSFIVEVIECLLHGLSKPLPEPSRIEVEEFLVEGAGCPWFMHGKIFRKGLVASFLIAVRDADPARKLIHDHPDY